MFAERQDDENLLNRHLDHGFADQCRREESREWHQEMTASDTSQVEKRVWYLKTKASDDTD